MPPIVSVSGVAGILVVLFFAEHLTAGRTGPAHPDGEADGSVDLPV